MLVDQKTNEMYIPLNNLVKRQKGYLEVCMICFLGCMYLHFNAAFALKFPLFTVLRTSDKFLG
jgi:hypothetical protein